MRISWKMLFGESMYYMWMYMLMIIERLQKKIEKKIIFIISFHNSYIIVIKAIIPNIVTSIFTFDWQHTQKNHLLEMNSSITVKHKWCKCFIIYPSLQWPTVVIQSMCYICVHPMLIFAEPDRHLCTLKSQPQITN